jgi:hypothetical protein
MFACMIRARLTAQLEKDYVDPPLTLFDNRAATYQKLEKPLKALRDGERMIRMARSDATVRPPLLSSLSNMPGVPPYGQDPDGDGQRRQSI